MSKEYFLKVYDKTGTTLKDTFNDIAFGSFVRRVGGGNGELLIEIPQTRTIQDEKIFQLNNYCDLFVKDIDAPSGVKLYSGYIEGINYIATGKRESTQLQLVGHFTKLAKYPCYRRDIDFTGASVQYADIGGITQIKTDTYRGLLGTTGGSASSVLVDKAIKSVIEYYQANAANPIVNHHKKVEINESSMMIDTVNKKPYLFAYWRFEGNLSDSSGNSRTLTTINGGGAYTPDMLQEALGLYKPSGYIGRAIYQYNYDLWEGLYLASADYKPTGIFSLAISFKKNTTSSANEALIYSGAESPAIRGLFLHVSSTGFITLAIRNASGVTTVNGTKTKVDDGTWHTVHVSRDATTYYLYVDGILEKFLVSAENPSYGGTNYVSIGGVYPAGTSAFGGFIDEVALWDGYALTADDVAELYGQRRIQPVGNELTYTFNSNTAKQIIDKLMEYLPSTWFYYVNADNLFILDEKRHLYSVPFDKINNYNQADVFLNSYFSLDTITNVGGELRFKEAEDTSYLIYKNFVEGVDLKGRFKNCFFGNGVDNYMDMSTNLYQKMAIDSTPNKSFGCWFNLSKLNKSDGSGHGLLQAYQEVGGVAYGTRMYISNDGRLVVDIADEVSAPGTNASYHNVDLTENKWHLVVVSTTTEDTASSTIRVKTYYDGQLISNRVQVAANANDTAKISSYGRAGCLNTAASNIYFIEGKIDDIFFTSQGVLAQADVWEMYYDRIPQHSLTYGKNVKKVEYKTSIKELVNNQLLAGTGIYNNYYDNQNEENKYSIVKYDDQWAISSDGRITNSDTARSRGESSVLSGRYPKAYINVEVVDNYAAIDGYDIESINIGDTVGISNLGLIAGVDLSNEVFSVVGITYAKTYATLELATVDQLLATEISRIVSKDAEETNADNPTSFDNVPVT